MSSTYSKIFQTNNAKRCCKPESTQHPGCVDSHYSFSPISNGFSNLSKYKLELGRKGPHAHVFRMPFFSSAMQRAKYYGLNSEDVQEYSSMYVKKNSYF